MKGFTLLELVLTLAIVAVLSVAGVSGYRTFGKNVEVSSISQGIGSELRQMQAKSMSGESGLKWGIRFVNSTTDYYVLFSTPSTYASATQVLATTTFPRSVSFSDPASGQSKDIIFEKITGLTTATSVTIMSENVSKTISVTAIGTIE